MSEQNLRGLEGGENTDADNQSAKNSSQEQAEEQQSSVFGSIFKRKSDR